MISRYLNTCLQVCSSPSKKHVRLRSAQTYMNDFYSNFNKNGFACIGICRWIVCGPLVHIGGYNSVLVDLSWLVRLVWKWKFCKSVMKLSNFLALQSWVFTQTSRAGNINPCPPLYIARNDATIVSVCSETMSSHSSRKFSDRRHGCRKCISSHSESRCVRTCDRCMKPDPSGIFFRVVGFVPTISLRCPTHTSGDYA